MEVKNFPEALRLCRKLKDWSQGDVGTAVGASQQTVAGWEKGRSNPRPDAYAKLVELFGADSPVAKFPPSEEDLAVTPRYVRWKMPPLAAQEAAPTLVYNQVAATNMADYINTFTTPSRDDSKLPQGKDMFTHEFAQKVKAAAPEAIRQNFDVVLSRGFGNGARNYVADYLGSNVCAEIKEAMTPGSIPRAVDDGVRQLLVYKGILEQQGREAPENLVLFVICNTESIANLFRSGGWSRVTFEAGMLGIEVRLAENPELIAEEIRRMEDGSHWADFAVYQRQDEN